MIKCLLVAILLLGQIVSCYALPDECIQAPMRKAACPHLIYKRAVLPIPSLNINKNEVVCLCLTDLKALQPFTGSRLEEIDLQVTLQRIANKYQLTEEDILNIVKN